MEQLELIFSDIFLELRGTGMLFAVDVGNTNITVGLFDGKNLIKTFRITTGTARTSDEYGVYFVDWLRVRDIHVSEIECGLLSRPLYRRLCTL